MLAIVKLLMAWMAIQAMLGVASATTYASFCDDAACSVNCGESVSVDNPGCLEEVGRNSIQFHDLNIQDVSLVFSPGDGCNCQDDCIDNIVTIGHEGDCYPLSGHQIARSFRFIGGSCGDNNCSP